jgi:hypothetical protein
MSSPTSDNQVPNRPYPQTGPTTGRGGLGTFAPMTELKVRARLRLNARRGADAGLRLRDCLIDVARDAGFAHWEHAREVLGGEAAPGDDMGTFWHAPRCDALLNAWFTSLADARAALASALASVVADSLVASPPPPASAGAQGRFSRGMATTVLFPYRRQFVLAGADFIRELGLDPQDAAWASAQHDLVRAYGGGAWQALALARLKAPLATFAPGR